VLRAVQPYWLTTRQLGEQASLPEAVVTPVLKKLCTEGKIETARGTYLGVLWRQKNPLARHEGA
jgi:hypothetical protein